MFPPEEASKKYTYDELLKLYNTNNKKQLVTVDNKKIMEKYVTHLEAEAEQTGGVCDDFNKEYIQQLIERFPLLEDYPVQNYTPLTKLKSYPNIYGMQQPHTDCKRLFQFVQFFSEQRYPSVHLLAVSTPGGTHVDTHGKHRTRSYIS